MPAVGISIGIHGNYDFFGRNRLGLAEDNAVQLRDVALESLIVSHVKRDFLCHRRLHACYQGQQSR